MSHQELNTVQLLLSPTFTTSFWHFIYASAHIPVIWLLVVLGFQRRWIHNLDSPFLHCVFVLFWSLSMLTHFFLAMEGVVTSRLYYLIMVRAITALPLFMCLLPMFPRKALSVPPISVFEERSAVLTAAQLRVDQEKQEYEGKLRALTRLAKSLYSRCGTLEAKLAGLEKSEHLRQEFSELQVSLRDMQNELIAAGGGSTAVNA